MVAFRQHDDDLWLSLSAEDLADAHGLEDLVPQLPPTCRRAIFDLAAIDRLHAIGLGHLLTLRRHLLARGCTDIAIAHPSAQVSELNQILGLQRVFGLAA